MHVAVIGTGYVGLVTGACLADMGNNVTCVEIDEKRLSALQHGHTPIHEKGLDTVVRTAIANKLLTFSNELSSAIQDAEYIFIAVGTPPKEDGSADLDQVLEVAAQIGKSLDHYAVIIDKSTVPVGTAELVRDTIEKQLSHRCEKVDFDVVSNPEFLKEGAAIEDFMRPDRIIIGTDHERARSKMKDLYAPFVRKNDRVLFMGIRDAEMTKYVANAMLATRISFMNEIAALCERMNVDVDNVRRGIGADKRIGSACLYPGCGYGGSCFPKDIRALIHMSHQRDFEPRLLEAVAARNHAQKQVLIEKIHRHFNGELHGRSFAIWGIAFKPGTDDIREAPSIVLIESLLKAGAMVRAYDPAAMDTFAEAFVSNQSAQRNITMCRDHYEALQGADAMVLVTEWKRFSQPDFRKMKRLLKTPVIFDGRNQYDPELMKKHGFIHYGIGRGENFQRT